MSEQHETESQKKTRLKFEREQAKSLGGLVRYGMIAMLAGLIAVIFLMALAGLRGAWVIAKRLPLFGVSGFIGIIAGIFVFIKLRIKIIPRIIITLLVMIIATSPFAYVSYKIYGKTNMHFATKYNVDYIQPMSGGTAQKVYEKRNQKGKILAELPAGERATVNGITMDYKEYNITTADGVTGWVGREAFPEDAAEMLAIIIGTDGIDSEEVAFDRKVEQFIEELMKKYLKVDRSLTIENVPTDFYKISDETLNRSKRVNVSVPLLSVGNKEYKKGAELSETGVNVVLENILYAEDCTILYLTVTDPKIWIFAGDVLNTIPWQTALTVKDLDTGEEYPLIFAQRNYFRTFNYKKVGGNYVSSVVYFFPPFKSRHFSLTHNGESALPIKKNDGYNGILGLLSSATGLSRAMDYYIDWNFPEVKVKF